MYSSHRLYRLFAFVFIFSSTSLCAQGQSGTLILQGATIIDGIADTALHDRSIIIEGNMIKDIVPANEPVPTGAQVIDLNGMYIMPGMIDTHVHWLGFMGELFVYHGVTSIVALLEIPEQTRQHSQDSFGLPRLYHSANRPPFGKDDSPAKIRAIMKEWLAKKPDIAHFPTHNAGLSKAYKIAADEAHRLGFMIFGHAENGPDAVVDGLDVVEHIWAWAQAVMPEQELVAFQRGDYLTWANHMNGRWDSLDALIKDAVAKDIYINPTLTYEWGGMSVNARQRELDDYSLLSQPELVYFPDSIAKSLMAKHRQIKNFSSRYGNLPFVKYLPEQDLAEFQEGYSNVKEFVKRYVAAGGKVQGGTDAITAGVPGLGLHQEMQMLVEAGLTPMQALKSTTRWSAELLEGRGNKRGPAKVGSIEKGKFADLIVLKADPLTDIRNSQQIEKVMKDGRWVPLELHPEYFSHTEPPRAIAGSTFAPVLSTVTPAVVTAGSPLVRVAIEGSGFLQTSLVRINGISVKTWFVNPRRIEFDLPTDMVKSALPNPYVSPGPYQQSAIIGDRDIDIDVFNPPPEGGMSNTISVMVKP
jgi:hypothetical protein